MNADNSRWRALPVFTELHDQWWAARGGRLGESQRPFSRDWDQLLEDAGQLSAEQRNEAERDVRMLADVGLVELKPVKYRPHIIARILIPVAVEERLAILFGDPLVKEELGTDLKSVAWAAELTFLSQVCVGVDTEDLLRLNDYFTQKGGDRAVVPIKERSLQIFGDEKRLDALLATSLFQSDRLSLDLLRCAIIGEPLGWKRGPDRAANRPIIVIENAATWHSYCRWNAERSLFSAVVYGKGFQSAASVQYLADIFSELGGERSIQYFGDLDPPGLEIPQLATSYALAHGLPKLEPHLWSYRQLLRIGQGKETDWEGDPADPLCLEWLGSLAEPVRALFARGKRLAQEHIGWEFLSRQARDDSSIVRPD